MVKECFELEMRLRQVLGLRESGSNYKHLMSELPVYKELVEAKNQIASISEEIAALKMDQERIEEERDHWKEEATKLKKMYEKEEQH